MSLSSNLLSLAELLLDDMGRLPTGAARRRAASTAYYALFHRLSSLCATQLMGAPQANSTYWRAYRALEHRPARSALARSDEFRVSLGAVFAELQDIREWADYSCALHHNEKNVELGKSFTTSEAQECVGLARQGIETIDRLDMPAKRRLSTLLLVRDRR